MRNETSRRLEQLAAAARLGLVTRQQAEGLGAGVSWLRCQVGKGRLRQLEADVFIVCSSVGGTDVPWQVEALAACLQRGTHARLGFQSAGRVWGLRCGGGPEAGRLHIVVPGPAAPRSTQRVSVHRTRRLTPADVTTYGELPVTTAARTIVDLAATLPVRDVERLVDDALVRGVTTVPLLSGCMGRNSRRGLAGTLALRAAIDLWLDGGLESHAESEVLRFLLRHRVPSPQRQVEVRAPDGRRLRVDLAWPIPRVVLEIDSFAHHHGPRQLSADHERRSVLAGLGWQVLTTTVAEVRRGGGNLLGALRTLGVISTGRRY